jgi:hypothetical protein
MTILSLSPNNISLIGFNILHEERIRSKCYKAGALEEFIKTTGITNFGLDNFKKNSEK